LVSVRNASEAAEALDGGADWIDLKEPSRGALGPVDIGDAREVVAIVDGRAPVSAAGGELRDWRRSAARELLSVAGISHLKLGLAHCRDTSWQKWWHAAHVELSSAGKASVVVVYADDRLANSPPPNEVISAMDGVDVGWLLVDTYDKSGGTLPELWNAQRLLETFAAVRTLGMKTAAAGRLAVDLFGDLPLEFIDIIGVRGAACRAERTSPVCRELVRRLREALGELAQGGGPATRPARSFSPAQRICLTRALVPPY
jgi:uncharacterized protein (UPF0264 family)